MSYHNHLGFNALDAIDDYDGYCEHCGGTGSEWQAGTQGGDGWTGKPCPCCVGEVVSWHPAPCPLCEKEVKGECFWDQHTGQVFHLACLGLPPLPKPEPIVWCSCPQVDGSPGKVGVDTCPDCGGEMFPF